MNWIKANKKYYQNDRRYKAQYNWSISKVDMVWELKSNIHDEMYLNKLSTAKKVADLIENG